MFQLFSRYVRWSAVIPRLRIFEFQSSCSNDPCAFDCFRNVFQLICDLHHNDLQWFPACFSSILNQSRWFLMFNPEILEFFSGVSTWVSLICADFPKISSESCFIFKFFPPPLVEKCVHAHVGFVHFCFPKRWFYREISLYGADIRKFPYMGAPI